MNLPRLLLALAACGCAHQPMPMDAAASLAAAETAFAAHSVREDMRVAFMEHFAADGVFVRTGWTNSTEYLRGQPAPPIVLDWSPRYVEVAAAGDLGLSTGPWKITSKVKVDAAPAYGQFVSVWRREGAGAWKVAADIGVGHPEPLLWNATRESRMTPGAPGPGSGGIEAAEAEFARLSASAGTPAAYAALGAQDLRYYRNGNPPQASRSAALASPAMEARRVAWRVERTETARSRDFGYARGTFAQDAAAPPLGWYLRVWRHEPAGWRIVLDVANPAPPPAPG